MIRHFPALLAAALCAVVAAPSMAANTPGVDSNYHVTGDAQAAPVQAFSVNGALYLQLHNVKDVPAPMTRSGQVLQYRIYGPYMVLPLTSYVMLHYGQWTAYVASAGVAAPVSQPVASVTTPVNAMDLSSPPPPPMQAPAGTGGPSATTGAVTLDSNTDAVTGTISSPGSNPRPVTASVFSGSNAQTAPIGDGAGLLNPNMRGGIVQIVADGTVAGAKAADSTMQSCMSMRLACRVQYTGAPSGKVQVEVLK